MPDIEIIICTQELVDVRQRLREIMDDLGYPSPSAAAHAAGLDPSHLHRLIHKVEPNIRTLRLIANGWGLPIIAFFLTRTSAAPLVCAAPHFLRQKRSRSTTPKNTLQDVA